MASFIQNSRFRTQNSADGGFTLVVVVMIVAIMAIMMAVAVQTVSFQMKREREAELIFRGQQYVEGIRLYRQKYGRYPMRMKELWEADPKVLRQKWTDPITGSEEWGLVYLGEDGQQVGGGPTAPGRPRPQATPTRTPVFGNRGLGGRGEKVGPIVGVHSLSTETSIKIYEGRTQYDEWKFVFTEGEQAEGPETPYGVVTPGPGGPQGGGGSGGGSGGGGTGGGGSGNPPPNPRPTSPWPPPPHRTGTPGY